jgi:hypothetical protein
MQKNKAKNKKKQLQKQMQLKQQTTAGEAAELPSFQDKPAPSKEKEKHHAS